MKYIVSLFFFFAVAQSAFAQPRYEIIPMPLCWTVGSVDSSLTRYVLVSSAGAVTTVRTVNAAGATVTVTGGSVRNGHCDCCAGGIDSTFVRGDSVFVATGGNEYYSGVNSAGVIYTAGSGISIVGDTIIATDNSATNELQTLSLAGNNLTLSNGGGTVALPSGADGNGVYGGSGTLPSNVNVNFQSARRLQFSNTGTGANEFIQFRDSTIFGLSEIAYYRNGVKTGKMFWDDAFYKRLIIQSEGGAISTGVVVGEGVFSIGSLSIGALSLGFDSLLTINSPKSYLRTFNIFNSGATSTQIPLIRPVGSNSFWQHNTDGTAQYVTPGAMAVTNPYGGTNTIQASLDSLNRPTNLTFTGSGPYTLNSSTGTDVTFSQGTGVTLTRTGNDLSISATAPPNVGGISAMYTSSGYSYTAEPLTLAVDAISLPTTVGTKSGMAKVVSGAGHGIEASFGGAATCQITAFVTLFAVDGDPFYLQVYVNGSPIYGSVYASTNADAGSTVKTATISHLAELNNGDVVTIRLHSTDSISCTILSAGLTVLKTQ